MGVNLEPFVEPTPDYSLVVGSIHFDVNWPIAQRQTRQLFSVYSGKLDDERLVAVKRVELTDVNRAGEDKLLELSHPSIIKAFTQERDLLYKYSSTHTTYSYSYLC